MRTNLKIKGNIKITAPNGGKETQRICSVSVLMLTALAAMPFLLNGCRGPKHGPPDMRVVDMIVSYKLDEVLDEIHATDDQRNEFHDVKTWILLSIEERMEEKRLDRAIFMQELMSDVPDARHLHAILQERLESKNEMAKDILDAVLDLHALLTREQREKLFQILNKKFKNAGVGLMDEGRQPPQRSRFRKMFHKLLHH